MQKIRNKTIINIGSVGNTIEISIPNDWNEDMSEITQAHYCIIEGDIDSKERISLSIQFVRVPYDIEEELKLARRNNSPSYEKYELELTKGKYRGKKKLNK